MRELLVACRSALVLTLVLVLTGCGYNTLQGADEQTKASWSEVVNQYQRRADLVPNLVATVRGEAGFEQATLTAVVEARAFPSNLTAMVFGYKEKPNFTVEDERVISKPPTVDLAKPARPGAEGSGAAK